MVLLNLRQIGIFGFDIHGFGGRHLIGSRIIECCNQKLISPLYLNSFQTHCLIESFGYYYHFYVGSKWSYYCRTLSWILVETNLSFNSKSGSLIVSFVIQIQIILEPNPNELRGIPVPLLFPIVRICKMIYRFDPQVKRMPDTSFSSNSWHFLFHSYGAVFFTITLQRFRERDR